MSARSYLYVPADQERLLARAADRGADALILDLEDAVAPSRKDAALEAMVAMLDAQTAEGPELWVRVNSGERGLDELRTLAGRPRLHGAWLPKAEPGPWLDAALAILRDVTRAGLLIETARGFARLAGLPALPGDTLLQLGEIDLAASLRARDLATSAGVFRALVVLEAAARDLPSPVAPVHADIRDLDGWAASSRLLRDQGFGARACIHPDQVGPVNEAFTVTDDEVRQAREVLEAFDAAVADGRGAFAAPDGSMVDLATVRSACHLLGETR